MSEPDIEAGDLWRNINGYRQVIRVDGDTVHWRNVGGKDRTSKLKNVLAWISPGGRFNASKVDLASSDLPAWVLSGLGAAWSDSECLAGGALIRVCKLDGRCYMGALDSDGYCDGYSIISERFYEAFVEEFSSDQFV